MDDPARHIGVAALKDANGAKTHFAFELSAIPKVEGLQCAIVAYAIHQGNNKDCEKDLHLLLKHIKKAFPTQAIVQNLTTQDIFSILFSVKHVFCCQCPDSSDDGTSSNEACDDSSDGE